MFKGVSSDIKLLLASVTITVIGILLHWVGNDATPLRGIHLKYGINLLILLIISLMVIHLKKSLASILIVITSSLACFIVIKAYIDLTGSAQSYSGLLDAPQFSPGIGIFVTGLGSICMMISGVTGVINHRRR